MVKLVKIDGEVLKKVPNILGFIEKYYGYDIPLIVYGVLIDEKFGFVVEMVMIVSILQIITWKWYLSK